MEVVSKFFEELYLVLFLSGLSIATVALVFLRFPPKKINMIYGYRTERSMKNQKNWDFAQRYGSREMLRSAIIMIAFSCIGLIYPLSEMAESMTGVGILIAVVVAMIVRVEAALKKFEQGQDDSI